MIKSPEYVRGGLRRGLKESSESQEGSSPYWVSENPYFGLCPFSAQRNSGSLESLILASPLYPTKNDSRQLEWDWEPMTEYMKIYGKCSTRLFYIPQIRKTPNNVCWQRIRRKDPSLPINVVFSAYSSSVRYPHLTPESPKAFSAKCLL